MSLSQNRAGVLIVAAFRLEWNQDWIRNESEQPRAATGSADVTAYQ